MARYLVTGGNGMVASYAAATFVGDELLSTDLDTMDIRSPEAIDKTFRGYRPDVVLHLAASTDVDRCEVDHDYAFRSNAMGTENLALACRRTGAVMVYASTGAVFPGDKPRPYVEYDQPRPSNVYAASKLAGEDAVRAHVEKHFIVRGGWIFGGGVKDKKFVGKLYSLIAAGRTELKVVDDKVGTPTYAKDFLQGIRRLLLTERYGVYHMGNEGSASRYAIAKEVARILGKTSVSISPVSSAEFPLPAPRGVSEAIENLKLRLIGLPPQRAWQEALAEYLAQELVPTAGATRQA